VLDFHLTDEAGGGEAIWPGIVLLGICTFMAANTCQTNPAPV
jgi:hypothetical protein